MKITKKIVNMPKLIKTIWFLLWAILIAMLVLKKLFNVWYPIVVKWEGFISFCSFIDKNEVLRYFIMFVLYVASANIMFLTLIKSKTYKNKLFALILNIIIICCWALKEFYTVLGMIIEIFYLVIVTSVINIKRKTFYPIIFNFIFSFIYFDTIMLWQRNILMIKGINDILDTLPFVIILVIQFDYYVFLLITLIGVNYMGIISPGWWFARKITKFKALKEAELKKEVPNRKYLAELDESIAKAQKDYDDYVKTQN